jgi:CBS domain containing-hemolysin-like protein
MVPRIDVLALDVNTPIRDARKEFINAGIPACRYMKTR